MRRYSRRQIGQVSGVRAARAWLVGRLPKRGGEGKGGGAGRGVLDYRYCRPSWKKHVAARNAALVVVDGVARNVALWE